jgi:hypothetical protein
MSKKEIIENTDFHNCRYTCWGGCCAVAAAAAAAAINRILRFFYCITTATITTTTTVLKSWLFASISVVTIILLSFLKISKISFFVVMHAQSCWTVVDSTKSVSAELS